MGDSTKVTVLTTGGGKQEFDLHNMTAEDAQRLYTALGSATNEKGEKTKVDYQELAKKVARLMKGYQSLVSAQLPDGVDIQNVIDDLSEEFKKTGGKLSDSLAQAKPYLKPLMDNDLVQMMAHNPVTRTGETMIGMANNVTDFFGGMGYSVFDIPKKIASATGSTAVEVKNKFSSPMSDEQAMALGTAYAGAAYAHIDGPLMPGQNREVKSDFWDKIVAFIEFGWDWLTSKTPFVKDIPAINAAPHAVMQWLFKHKDWKTAWASAQEHAADLKTHDVTFDATLKANLSGRELDGARKDIGTTLIAAEKVDGFSTESLATMATKQTIVRDQDGVLQKVKWPNGIPVMEPIKDSHGKPITAQSKVNEQWNNLVPETDAGKAGFVVWNGVKIDLLAGAARGYLNKTGVTTLDAWSKYDFVNRAGGGLGEWVGKVGEKTASGLNKLYGGLGIKATATAAKVPNYMVYAYDGVQGLRDVMHGDYRGGLENAGQIGGAWGGSELAIKTTEKLTVDLAKTVPGRAKLFVFGAGLLGLKYGRDWGGYLGNQAADLIPGLKDPNETASNGLKEANVQYTQNAEQKNQDLEALQKNGKVDLTKLKDIDPALLQSMSDYNQKNAPVKGVNGQTLQSQGPGASNGMGF